MSIIGKVGKLARQAVVSDSLLEKTVSPLVNKSVEGLKILLTLMLKFLMFWVLILLKLKIF